MFALREDEDEEEEEEEESIEPVAKRAKTRQFFITQVLESPSLDLLCCCNLFVLLIYL